MAECHFLDLPAALCYRHPGLTASLLKCHLKTDFSARQLFSGNQKTWCKEACTKSTLKGRCAAENHVEIVWLVGGDFGRLFSEGWEGSGYVWLSKNLFGESAY